MLCDTNGGTLPHEVERIVGEVVEYLGGDVRVAVHLHDDAGTGVANAIAGVLGGATQVQGTINGYGERTGNCNLTAIIPNLTLKMGIETIPRDRMERLTPVAHHVAELVNMPLNPQMAYVGHSAFAHKAGLHTSAIAKRPDAYEHLSPDVVGNGTRFVVSELAGKSTLGLKARELGLELDGPQLAEVVEQLKRLEHEGYHFEVADGSLELLMRRATGWEPDWFAVESFRVITDDRTGVATLTDATGATVTTEATVKVRRGRAARDRDRRGQRSGERARQCVAEGAQRQLPRARARAPHRLQGARARHAEGHRRGHPGADRLHRRRADVDDDRRQREHHRGVVAGAARLGPLRVAAQRGVDQEPRLTSRAMPTDPFVPSDLADRPRQQQNLPPGLAPPPARDWRADRPGDLAGAQPDGALLGRPGPNVGYAYTLAARARDWLRLAPSEHADDALAVIAEIAASEPAAFGRAPVMGDIDVAIALLGYDGVADDAFVEKRARLVHEASHSYIRRRALVDAVPDTLLRKRMAEVAQSVDEWRSQLAA